MPLLPVVFISKKIDDFLSVSLTMLAMAFVLWPTHVFSSDTSQRSPDTSQRSPDTSQLSPGTSRLPITDFKSKGLDDWERKSFQNETQYSLVQVDQQTVLKAQAKDSASGLFKSVSVDLTQYPYINWRWRADTALATEDERKKGHDDYVARIYLVIKGGLFVWKTKAINYVWANKSKKGVVWPNAFAKDNAMMLAVRNNEDPTGVWFAEKRHLLADLKTVFGEEINQIDVVAIMTDTDNNGGTAIAYYGDIFFSKD